MNETQTHAPEPMPEASGSGRPPRKTAVGDEPAPGHDPKLISLLGQLVRRQRSNPISVREENDYWQQLTVLFPSESEPIERFRVVFNRGIELPLRKFKDYVGDLIIEDEVGEFILDAILSHQTHRIFYEPLISSHAQEIAAGLRSEVEKPKGHVFSAELIISSYLDGVKHHLNQP